MAKHTLPPHPAILRPELSERVQQVSSRLLEVPSLLEALESNPGVWETALQVFAVSEFVLKQALRQPRVFGERVATFHNPPDGRAVQQSFENASRGSETDILAGLRLERNLAMAHIAWRDLAGWSDLDEGLHSLSQLADDAIRCAVDIGVEELSGRHGVPVSSNGEPIAPVVLAMGKLGGQELNFSSDIDLIFLYTESGQTDGGRSITAEEFFTRLGQKFIKLLDQNTDGGFVFRVDTRLRPFGKSGPLAVSFSALESYLLRHGRDWERYAYIKARSVTNQDLHDSLFDEILRPFVYRRYVDFGVFESLRHMKGLIEAEVTRQDLHSNIKLGPGGIREIEFIVQSLQLVRGGQDANLRERNLLQLLPRLTDERLLGPEPVAELTSAYRFLRTLENRLQAMDDRQTHDFPEDENLQARLALAMGCDRKALIEQFEHHRALVTKHFEAILRTEQPSESAGTEEGLTAWDRSDVAALTERLQAEGIQNADRVAEQLVTFRDGSFFDRLDELSRQRFHRLVPKLAMAFSGKRSPETIMERLQPLWSAVARRSAYVSLLNENPTALRRLVDLAERSEFLVQLLVQSPLLLDVLLDARVFEEPPTREELQAELSQLRDQAGQEDIEGQLDAMRQFQRAAVFRIAVSDLTGHLTLMKVSDRLTETAQMLLECALDMSLRELIARHGMPMCVVEGHSRPAGFAVIGYGKMGGLELGYGSDLDLVFVHDSEGGKQETNGGRPLDNGQFFARLAQRLIHYLSIQTSSGRLYEIDTRLRPSGRSGLMVAALKSFGRYQREDAWIWEHQALLRSRAVAGDPSVCEAFERERKAILVSHVDRLRLKQEVVRMRQRMRTELSKARPGNFDLKQGPGGLADIEFLVDYWVLANAGDHPDLVTYPDKVRQLESLEKDGLIPSAVAHDLIDIYLRLRVQIHRLSLAGEERLLPDNEFEKERARVTELWSQHLG